MQPHLCWSRLFLSSREDDWVWARWWRARPGARPLDLISAYGFMVWETDISHPQPQPGMPLERGSYVRERVSPYPGLHHLGPDEHWLDGVPDAARDFDAAESHCGVETFWSDWPARVMPSSAAPPDGVLSMAGGGEGGGMVVLSGPCRIWYGACLHVRGGAEGGGELVTGSGESFVLRGGAEGGGELPIGYGESLLLAGGGEGGGEIPTEPSGGMALRGGGEGGGEIPSVGGSTLALAGGGEGGGHIPTEGGGPPMPTFVAAERSGPGTGTLTLAVPPGAAVDDTLVISAMVVGASATWTTPSGWTVVGTGNIGPANGSYAVYRMLAGGSPPSSVDVDFTSFNQASGTVTIVADAGSMIVGTSNSGLGAVASPGTIGVTVDHSLVLWYVGTSGDNTTADCPPIWTLADADMPGTDVVEFSTEDVDAGTVPDPDSDLDAVDTWVSFVVVVDPE